VEGAACLPESDLETAGFRCFPDQLVGAECGFGIGLCKAGAICNWTTFAFDNALCYPDGDAGTPCKVAANDVGMGACKDGLTCFWESATEQSAACFPDGDLGEPCGSPGFGGCQGSYNACGLDPNADTGTCQPAGLAGALCGDGNGWCYPGTSCLFDDASETTSHCQKWVFEGLECGFGLAGCWPPLGCITESDEDTVGICTDLCTFVDPKTGESQKTYYENGECDSICWNYDPDCAY